MSRILSGLLALLFVGLACSSPVYGQAWTDRVRGSWVADEKTTGGIMLASKDAVCEIVVAAKEESCVQQAAKFLAGDIEKISGYRPQVVEKPTAGKVAIVLMTTPDARWEAYDIRTSANGNIVLVGSNPRGTAFAAYTLCERLGVDPLYLWTGYEPEHHDPLVMKPTDFSSGPPTFKYRGMFHDDEDILPRPFETPGYPLRTGDVPNEWYAKYFETALRLRMNMVAPYTRVHRRYEVQKMASDWGLFYTSHHYDVLLSNPFGMERYGLANERGVSGAWDWINNRDNMLRYWRGGVEENKDINCIWPVGLRGTDDYGYKFPPKTTDDEQAAIFKDVIEEQVKLTKDLLPPDKQPPAFHWTLYTEMLPKYQSGKLEVPDDVIIVWPDDNDGTMRGLPDHKDRWKHGIYYHLAYLGKQVKQNAHIVSPARVAEQFSRIVDTGATEYMLVNVSELREFIMEARMLAEICWDAKTALAGDDPAKRYIDWWCREYFPDAPEATAKSYAGYYKAFDSFDKLAFGSESVHTALAKAPEADPTAMQTRLDMVRPIVAEAEATAAKLKWPQQQFFFEHVVLPLQFDYRPMEAAAAIRSGSPDKAMTQLEQMETAILRAERTPFESWYRETWIRRGPKPVNVHRPYQELRLFMSTGGKRFELPDLGRFTTTKPAKETKQAKATSRPASR